MAYNILIVDDSQTSRAYMVKALEVAGVDVGAVLEASNGQEALTALRDNWVDIVFADLNMPVMNGVQMIAKMAEDGLLTTVPVVIVSTERSAARIAELQSQGVRCYIKKPFTPETLKETIDNLLGAGKENGP